MKNRIWNQTKAAVLAMAAILSGICVPFQEMQVSGAELVAPVLNIEQSAKWTDEENYKAELTLRLSGLNTLKDVSKVDQEQEKIQLYRRCGGEGGRRLWGRWSSGES